MKITIVTVVRNNVVSIGGTIKSVIEQNNVNLEYIVIDGASIDGTVNIIRKYQTELTYWISEPDRGISDAFNKGIRMATGDIIGIVSADDYLLPGALEHVARTFFENPDADVIYGNAVFIEPYNHRQFVIKPDIGLRTIWRRQPLKHAATFVSRRAYEKFGLFDLQYRLAMDYELVLRFYLGGAKFVYVDHPLAAFRTGGISTHSPVRTVREVRDIQIRYGLSPLKAYPVYWGKCAKLLARQRIIRAGGVPLLNLYRQLSTRFTPHT
jgi:glycosyltransferase involved in cell wall biosynthesis